MLKFAVGPWVAQQYGTAQCTGKPPRSLRKKRESSAPSLRRRPPRETTFGISEDDTSEERHWTPAMQACTSTAAVHHRPPSGGTPTSRRSMQNGFLTNGCTNSNVYGTTYSTTSNGYGNGALSAKPPLNAARASPRLSQGCGASPRSSVASYSSHTSGIGASPPMARRSPQSNKSNSPVTEDSLVTIRMRPDAMGRFGFNVKGGADQNYPVIVSRVAPGSSADKAHPRLNEGDQVLFINGRDVTPMSHDTVVDFIRSARSAPNGGELVLTIKPNVYRLGEEVEEPEGAALPEQMRVAESVPRSDKLSHSLRLLSDALATGRIVSQFEQLYRKKPGMTMNDCRLTSNLNKNRYRDVCPYDATRVRLSSSPNGDYINANFVNMEIPSSGIVNRYIACQGPLAHTSADHWLMVWEQLCTHIVMLTTTIERGRAKCHQYWPRLHESHEYGRLLVTCIRDHDTPNCSYREFSVRDRTSKEERRVTQMQYTAWPDHGVPDDPQHFISFVGEVRRARAGSVDPIVVHCSAGIGRTGVLILMETAACLVEANEPVYPLDIVRLGNERFRPEAIMMSWNF
nr:PDZ and Protein-tyrosine phosphatase domain containing protein [Haemonchus contortus]